MIEFMIGLMVGWICGIVFSTGVFLRKREECKKEGKQWENAHGERMKVFGGLIVGMNL
jgi:hypothetical protein